MSDKKYKSQINITIEVSSETMDIPALQRALYKAGGGMAAAMYDYLRQALSDELGEPEKDFAITIERLVWN